MLDSLLDKAFPLQPFRALPFIEAGSRRPGPRWTPCGTCSPFGGCPSLRRLIDRGRDRRQGPAALSGAALH